MLDIVAIDIVYNSMLQPHYPVTTPNLDEISTLELAQVLMERLSISPNDWHRFKSNRSARCREQVAAALVYLLKEQPEEALPRLQQAVGWLDRSISAPPCPTHGDRADMTNMTKKNS